MARDNSKTRLKNTNRHDVGAVIYKILEQYADQLNYGFRTEVEEVAKEIVEDIEKNAPRRPRSKTEGYYNSWLYEPVNSKYNSGYVIFSNNPGLPHLLEFGHASRNGGRVPPSPLGGHIAPAEEKAAAELEKRILEVIKNAS